MMNLLSNVHVDRRSVIHAGPSCHLARSVIDETRKRNDIVEIMPDEGCVSSATTRDVAT